MERLRDLKPEFDRFGVDAWRPQMRRESLSRIWFHYFVVCGPHAILIKSTRYSVQACQGTGKTIPSGVTRRNDCR